MKPNSVGSKSLWLNPTYVEFSTAEFALIDSAISNTAGSIYPYAYTATVRSDYDAVNYGAADIGSAQVAGQRLAFGLFLSPENDKHNMLFQLTGRVMIGGTSTTNFVKGSFFFGRKATNNTVVSSKAGASNALASYTLLPSQQGYTSFAAASGVVCESIETEVFSLELAGGFVYCFGYLIDVNGSTDMTWKAGSLVSLAYRKWSSELSIFRPSTA